MRPIDTYIITYVIIYAIAITHVCFFFFYYCHFLSRCYDTLSRLLMPLDTCRVSRYYYIFRHYARHFFRHIYAIISLPIIDIADAMPLHYYAILIIDITHYLLISRAAIIADIAAMPLLMMIY